MQPTFSKSTLSCMCGGAGQNVGGGRNPAHVAGPQCGGEVVQAPDLVSKWRVSCVGRAASPLPAGEAGARGSAARRARRRAARLLGCA